MIGIRNGTLWDYFQPLSHLNFVFASAYLGIPSTLISALIMAYMLANMEAVKATIFGNLSTAISIVAGVLVLGRASSVLSRHLHDTDHCRCGRTQYAVRGKKKKLNIKINMKEG